jgi:hypothetical protein
MPRGVVCSPARSIAGDLHLCCKVRVSLLKARFALSCCGILSDREIFRFGKRQKTNPPQFLKIFRSRNAHLYRLVRELTPGNGSIERHG